MRFLMEKRANLPLSNLKIIPAELHPITKENVIKLQLISIIILFTPTLK